MPEIWIKEHRHASCEYLKEICAELNLPSHRFLSEPVAASAYFAHCFKETEDLWRAVQQETDPNAKRLRMVELAKLLLKYAAMEASETENISETYQLTDFFIEYLDTADLMTAFFHAALPHLEPELMGSEFEEQIREAEDQLAQILKRSEKMRTSNAKLTDQKDRLTAESKKLEALESELDHLRHLEAGLKPENMVALAEEIAFLKEKTAGQEPEKQRLEAEKARLEELSQVMEAMTASLSEDKTGVIEHLRELSENLSVSLDEDWDACDMRLFRDLRTLKQKNRMYQEVIAKLDECVKTLLETTEAEKVNRELFERHFSANAEICKTTAHVSALSGQIAENLREFDLELKKIIQAKILSAGSGG